MVGNLELPGCNNEAGTIGPLLGRRRFLKEKEILIIRMTRATNGRTDGRMDGWMVPAWNIFKG